MQTPIVEVKEREESGNEFPALSGAVIIHADQTVSEITKVYTFLSSQKKEELRKLGRVWGCRTAGNTSEQIYRAFLFLKECYHKRLDIREIMESSIHCPSFEDCLEAQDLSCASWKPPPNLSVFRNALMAAGNKGGEHGRPIVKDKKAREHQNEENPCGPNFSISDFWQANLVNEGRRKDENRSF